MAAPDDTPSSATTRYLAIATFLAIMPVTLVVAVLRQLVQDRYGVGDTATAAFMSINMVGAVVAAPLAGMISDRIGRRRPIIVGALLIDAGLLLALSVAPTYESLMAIRFLEGMAHITALSLILALAAGHARATGRSTVMGAVGATLTLGVALGAPLGGALGKIGTSMPLQVGAGLSVVAAVFAFLTLRDDARPAPRRGGGIELIARRRQLLVPLAYAFADRFTVGFFTTIFVLYLGKIHGMGPGGIGALLALFLLPFAILCYPIGRLAGNRSRVAFIGGGSFAYGLAMAAVAVVPVDALFVLLPILGILSSVMFIPTLMLTGELAGPADRGLAMGSFNAAGSLGFIVGPLVGGAVSQGVAAAYSAETGYAAAFAVGGAAEILCVALTLPFLIRIERARSQSTADADSA